MHHRIPAGDRVRFEGKGTVTVGADAWPVDGSLTLGGFRQPVVAQVEGDVRVTPGHSTQIAQLTDRVQSATVIAKAINMGLHDKMAALAEKMHSTPKALSGMADRLTTRLDSVMTRGAQAEAGMHALCDDFEKGVAATEDALNQLTNGAPVLPGESSPQ